MIGEQASRSSLELPGRQLELLQAVVATGTPTVLLVMNGRPLDLRWAAENVPAILDIWYPGHPGRRGRREPALRRRLARWEAPVHLAAVGRPGPDDLLAHALPRTREPGPPLLGRASTPLFPFGHGLSYGRFTYSDLVVDQPSVTPDGNVTVSVRVTNVGDREATTSSSCTCTSATGPPPGPSASSRASSG